MSRKITDSPTFCPLMWLGATRSNIGSYLPCCQYNDENLKYNRWSEQLSKNISVFDDDRKQLAEGLKPDGCQHCWHNESLGIESLRTEVMSMDWWRPHIDSINQNTQPNGSFNQDPVYIDLKLGNKYNLGCRMCSPEFSSVLAKEVEDNLSEFDHDLDQKNSLESIKRYHHTEDMDRVFDTIKKLDGLIRIQFTGGEPFLNKQLPDLLDHFIQTGKSKGIIVTLTTNLTTLPNTLFDQLDHFRSFDINVSMEGIGTTYEYIRYPAKWEKFVTNFNKLQNTNVNMVVVYTGTALSILGFPEWLDWIHQQDVSWNYNPVLYPQYLMINNIPQPLKELLINDLESQKKKYQNQHMIDGVINMLKTPMDREQWQILIKDTSVKDRLRSQSIHRSVPKLAEFMAVDR